MKTNQHLSDLDIECVPETEAELFGGREAACGGTVLVMKVKTFLNTSGQRPVCLQHMAIL